MNSHWFCLQSGFRCIVGRSLCYKSLLGTRHSINELKTNPLFKVLMERPCFLAGFMSITITHCLRNWLKEPSAVTRTGNGCVWVRVNNQRCVNYSQLRRVLKKPAVSMCMDSSGSGKIMITSSFEHVRALEYQLMRKNPERLSASEELLLLSSSINKPTRCTFCMYLFYNFCTILHVSNDHFVHRQEFINLLYLQLCTNRANVSNCSVLRLEQP